MKRHRSTSTGRFISASKKKRIDVFKANNVRKIINDHSYSSKLCDHGDNDSDIAECLPVVDDSEENSYASGDSLDRQIDNVNDTTEISWRQGRRIVELGFIVDKLSEGCSVCHSSVPLNITNTVHEIRYGLGSLLTIRCALCDGKTVVPTGKRHSGPNERQGQRTWDVNTKLALGKK